MHFYELLAQDDGFPLQGIIILIAVIFSFLKWLYENITGKAKQDQSESDDIESIYEQYRDEIQQRQTQTSPPEFSPPPLPEVIEQSPIVEATEYQEIPAQQFSQEDIERLRARKPVSAYTIESEQHSSSLKAASSHKLRTELKKKNSLRKAILLREILGPPKALSDQVSR
jgi:hypothetical protein